MRINFSKLYQAVMWLVAMGVLIYLVFLYIRNPKHDVADIIFILIIANLLLMFFIHLFMKAVNMIIYPNIDKLARKKDINKLKRALTYNDADIRSRAAESIKVINGVEAGKYLAETSESKVDKILLGIAFAPICLFPVLLLLLFILIFWGYNFISKLARKISINMSKVLKAIIAAAIIDGCVYAVYLLDKSPRSSLGGVIGVSIPLFIFLIICGWFLIHALKMIIYPNVSKLASKKDVRGLIRALRYDDWEIKGQAAEALREIGDPRASKYLAKYDSELAEMSDDSWMYKSRPSGMYF
jgi:HEAT repeat protein